MADDDAMPPALMGLMRQATQTDAHGGANPNLPADDDDAMPPPLMGSLMRQATETNPHGAGAGGPITGPHQFDTKMPADPFSGDVPPPQLTLLKHPTIADAHGQVSLLSPASRQSSGVVVHTPPASAAATAAAAAAADVKGDPVFGARHLQSFSRVGAPVPSPSGRHVVFTVKQLRNGVETHGEWYHEDTNSAFTTGLWIADVTPGFLSGKTLHPAPATGADAKSAAAPAAAAYDGHVRRLTNPPEKKSDFEPLWLDDQTVAFLSTRGGAGAGSQLWCIAIGGGEAQPLSSYPVSIEHVKWNGVRSFVTFAADVYTDAKGDGKAVLAETAKRDADRAKRPANFQKYSKLFARRWDKFVDPSKRTHVFAQPLHKSVHGVWTVPATTGPVDVMAGVDADCPQPPFGDASQYAISPFGDELAFATHSVTGSEVAWSTAVKVYTVKLELHTVAAPKPPASAATVAGAGAAVRIPLPTVTLTAGAPVNVSALAPGATAGNDHSPAYSPDGKSLVYLSMKRAQFEADRNRLMRYDRGTKATTELASGWTLSPSAFVWSHDSTQLVLTAECKAHSAIWLLNVAAAAATASVVPTPIVSKAWNYNVALLGAQHVVFSRDSFAAPAELYACKLADGGQFTKLTALNDAKLAALPHPLPAADEFHFAGAGNDQVQAWLFKPVGFAAAAVAAGHKYPVACVIHGGPQGAVGDHWHYRWNPHPLTAAGFAVVIINFHGSTGFGQAFTDSISGDWGGAPFDDLMKGMDHALAAYPWLDATRQVALGASYGGFMINWVNAHSRRFRALVNHDGVFNQTAMYYTTEELYFCEFEFRGQPHPLGASASASGGASAAAASLYDKFSPHRFVDQMATPTLVIHGGKDYRVPETEGLATFTALQRRGVPSELLYFPEENHWVLSPANSVVWHTEVVAWIKRWTK